MATRVSLWDSMTCGGLGEDTRVYLAGDDVGELAAVCYLIGLTLPLGGVALPETPLRITRRQAKRAQALGSLYCPWDVMMTRLRRATKQPVRVTVSTGDQERSG